MGVCASDSAPANEAPQNDANMLCEYSSGTHFKCDPKGEIAIKFAKAGPASQAETPAETLIDVFKRAVKNHGAKPALKVERPCPDLVDGRSPAALPEHKWTAWSFQQYMDEVHFAAKGFIKLGLQRHDSVNVWGFNSPEWFITAFAAVWAGGKTAGLYPTDTDDTAAYKVVHSGGSIVVIEDAIKLKKLKAGLLKRGDAKRIKAIVAYGYEPVEGEKADIPGCGEVPVISWKALIDMGKAEDDTAVSARHAEIKPGQCAFLIYTSGTTGEPKAVMITHDNIIFESGAVLQMMGDTAKFGQGGDQERMLSYLPLSHVAGMMVDIVSSLLSSARGTSWVTVYFARSYDLKVGAIKDRLCVCRPTFFLGVPLVWEKIADKLRSIGANSTGAAKRMGDWAKGIALENSKSKQLGRTIVEPVGITPAAALLSKVKKGLGLEMCKVGMTGAAPIRVDTLEYFGSLGLIIIEVYGMSECTGAATISSPHCHQWGSCGYETPGVEVRAFKVDEKDFNKRTPVERSPSLEDLDEKYQGELCYRGRNVMMGYMSQEDLGKDHVAEIQKKTAETIDDEGWLHSGDKGMITTKGMVKITGRYKELIIGEGGENIAPVPIEDHVKKACDGVAEIMMVGDKRKYNIAIVTLKAVGANGEVPGTDMLESGAVRVNPNVKTISGAMKDKEWIDYITKGINSANANGKVCSNNAAKIQKFTILPTNFSEMGGELTPTKKLKRAVVQKAYMEFIEKMYATEGVYIEFTPTQ